MQKVHAWFITSVHQSVRPLSKQIRVVNSNCIFMFKFNISPNSRPQFLVSRTAWLTDWLSLTDRWTKCPDNLVFRITILQCVRVRYMNVMTLAAISTGAGVGLRFILRSRAYQNNSLVSLEDIGEGRDALYCITNKSACCRPPYTPTALGNWFFPNGTRVLSSGARWDFHRTRGQMVVLLQRRRGGENGIYRCVVPDATNDIQTIYIGVYTGSPSEFRWKCNF